MTNLNVIHCARQRAHLAGAEAVIHAKDGNHAAALSARARYFRELAAIDILLGRTPSPFEHLG